MKLPNQVTHNSCILACTLLASSKHCIFCWKIYDAPCLHQVRNGGLRHFQPCKIAITLFRFLLVNKEIPSFRAREELACLDSWNKMPTALRRPRGAGPGGGGGGWQSSCGTPPPSPGSPPSRSRWGCRTSCWAQLVLAPVILSGFWSVLIVKKYIEKICKTYTLIIQCENKQTCMMSPTVNPHHDLVRTRSSFCSWEFTIVPWE